MELAAVLEVSPAYLSLIATNRQPMSEPIAFKMEKLFGFSTEWILYEKEPRRIDSIREGELFKLICVFIEHRLDFRI